MALKENKIVTRQTPTRYKASDKESFASNYNDNSPYYTELANGDSVEVNLNNKHVKSWLANNIIVKE